MGSIDGQEPEVKDLKQAARPAATILPHPDVWTGTKFTPRLMFAGSSLEFGQQKKWRAFATTTSFVLNCLASGVLIMPLVFTESLPKAQLLTFLVVPPPPPPPPPPAADRVPRVRQIQSDVLNTGQLRTPTKIPQKVQMIRGDEAPPVPAGSGGGIGGFGGVPGGRIGGVIVSTVSSTSNVAAVPMFVPSTPQRVRSSQAVTKDLLMEKLAARIFPLGAGSPCAGRRRLERSSRGQRPDHQSPAGQAGTLGWFQRRSRPSSSGVTYAFCPMGGRSTWRPPSP